MDMITALIAMGGNQGNVRASFMAARSALDALPETRVIASSLLYQTQPLGPQNQPDFMNAVVALETKYGAMSLLHAMQEIERQNGRVRSGDHWGPRTLDLDLLSYNDILSDTEELTLPHPEMHKRQFVLRPLCDIAPNWQHPLLGRSAIELLGDLLESGLAPLARGEEW